MRIFVSECLIYIIGKHLLRLTAKKTKQQIVSILLNTFSYSPYNFLRLEATRNQFVIQEYVDLLTSYFNI